MTDDGESAIEQALLAAYPGAKPVRFAMPEASKTELAGCIAIHIAQPVPHWLVVSRGFTELDAKVEEDPNVSGWGFELTCRLPARSEEPDFGWIVSWMQNVSDYLAAQVTVIEAYHHIPIWKANREDELAALVFVRENELRSTHSRNGSVGFLQMVGLTTGEYDALQAWDARSLVDLIRKRDPLLLIDAERSSYMRDAAFACAVEEGKERDGSSTAVMHGVPVLWFVEPDGIQVHLSVEAVGLLKWTLSARLSHGKSMAFFGERRRTVRADGSLAVHSQVNVVLHPEKGASEIAESDEHGRTCVLRLSADARAELANMRETPGTYTFGSLKSVTLVVVTAERLREPRYPA
jgi:hypothetical protein